jgi:hypothetical protein
MMTVRFPNGFSVTYNDAHFAHRGAAYTDLYTESNQAKRKWIAQVPNTALIEYRPACKAFQVGAGDQLEQILHSLENRAIGHDWSTANMLKRIKLALVDFDARRGCWK